jgi:hypothetical protein
MKLKPQPIVTDWCPVCHGKRADKAAIDAHNLRVSRDGERSYSWR